jgi:hypothetical protein
MQIELTSNGVTFDWWLASAAGAGFCLLPVRGYHTKDDVTEAKAYLRRTRDVVTLLVKWQKPQAHETIEFLKVQTELGGYTT